MVLEKNKLQKVLTDIREEIITVTFLNSDYIKLFEVFYRFWKNHNTRPLLVVCLDELSLRYVEQFDVCVLHYCYAIKNKHNFWKIRLQILNDIFTSSKKTIIHTDVDCFWIKNIIPLLINYEVDGIYSTGHSYPKHIASKYGFVFCCGFFIIKHNNKTKDYFVKILHQQSKDDQVATNNLIFNNVITITECNNLNNPFSHIVDTDFITIGGIKTNVVTRWTSPPKHVLHNCYCYHPFLDGNIDDKLSSLNQTLTLL